LHTKLPSADSQLHEAPHRPHFQVYTGSMGRNLGLGSQEVQKLVSFYRDTVYFEFRVLYRFYSNRMWMTHFFRWLFTFHSNDQ